MSDLIMYYFFHIAPLLIEYGLILAFIIVPIRAGLEMIENTFNK